jgi:two-component system chemotaxis response regulator CheB
VLRRDIIVVGASAGGIEAITQVASALPADFAAAMLVVVHIPPWNHSELARIIDGQSRIPAFQARGGEPIEPGRIYVAPPDHHLLVDHQQVQLWLGPKENRSRPAINPLFRSAAVTYGPRVIGVILTGLLDDGSAGLWWVKHFGGAAVVQDPSDAQFPDMPRNALQYVNADHVVGIGAMGPLLVQLTGGASAPAAEPISTEHPLWKPNG